MHSGVPVHSVSRSADCTNCHLQTCLHYALGFHSALGNCTVLYLHCASYTVLHWDANLAKTQRNSGRRHYSRHFDRRPWRSGEHLIYHYACETTELRCISISEISSLPPISQHLRYPHPSISHLSIPLWCGEKEDLRVCGAALHCSVSLWSLINDRHRQRQCSKTPLKKSKYRSLGALSASISSLTSDFMPSQYCACLPVFLCYVTLGFLLNFIQKFIYWNNLFLFARYFPLPFSPFLTIWLPENRLILIWQP